MNLYKFYSDPIGLVGYTDAHNMVPDLILEYLEKHQNAKLNATQIQALASDVFSAWAYAKHYLKGRFPEGEKIIATDPVYAQLYAKYIIKDRWLPGEAAIATSAEKSYYYANDVLGDRFPAGEAVIAENSNYAYFYAYDIIKGKWPPGEKAIRRDPLKWLKYLDLLQSKAPKHL
jgi:hypothetical protein